MNIKLNFLCVLLCAFILAGCAEPPPETFDIAGKVMYGSTPIENAKVVSDIAGEVYTDVDGNFEFTGLAAATELSFSADGYVFVKTKEVVYKETKNLEIRAEKTYMLTGKIISNNIGVAGATVEISGLTPMTVVTNSSGYFDAIVAGEVSICASKTGFLFEQNVIASITQNDITISGTTDIEATITGVEGAVLTVGDVPMTLENGVYKASNIALGSVVTPMLDGYHFEPASYTIRKENEKINFEAFELYTVSGVTKSGNKAVANVEILINGESAATSNASGEFCVMNLWGDNSISFVHSICAFNSQMIDSADTLEVQGTFTLRGKVLCGGAPLKDARVTKGDQSPIPTDEHGEFEFSGVQFGDTIRCEKDGYKIDDLVVNSPSNVIIEAEEYFGAKITVLEDNSPIAGASVVVVGQDVLTTDDRGVVEFGDLLEGFEATISKPGYTSRVVQIDRENNVLTVRLDKIFDINITVHSAEITLNSSATVRVNNVVTDCLNEGNLMVEDCVGTIKIDVEVPGYLPATLYADKNNNALDFNLSYIVTGVIKSGEIEVDAIVTATDQNAQQATIATSAGDFEIELRGKNTLAFVADGYNEFVLAGEMIDRVEVSSEREIIINCRYDISGVLTSDGEAVENATLVLVGATENREAKTLADGAYAFGGLVGEYTLMITDNAGVDLHPSTYTITRGGEYNFDASGYSVGGVVLCGDAPLGGVIVTAGGATAITNENGEFVFELISGTPQMQAAKTGYAIENTYTLSTEDDGKMDFVFNATYSVTGRVLCGDVAVVDCEVTLGDQIIMTDSEGCFAFAGLVGEHTLAISKAGYEFAFDSAVTGYENKIIAATMTLSGRAMSGETALAGVTITCGQYYTTTNSAGEFTMSGLKIGDTLVATKAGYKFATAVTIEEFGQELNFSATYSIRGVVKSAGAPVAGVVVTFAGKQTTTDSRGAFGFEGLNSVGEMTFAKSGFDFAPVSVTGPLIGAESGLEQDLEVLAAFSISGKISLGRVGLSGVKVSASDTNYAMTDSEGNYTLRNLSSGGWLTLEKEGYEFGGNFNFTGAGTYDFAATYYVKFKVDAGGAQLGEAVLTTTANYDTLPDNTFIIRGLVGQHVFSINANNFDEAQVVVNDYEPNMVVRLTYGVTLKLSAPLGGVKVVYSDNLGEKETTFDANGAVYLSNLYGAGAWSISKENYMFTPNSGTYQFAKMVDNISYKIVYSIHGRVTAANGAIGVSGMLMDMNGQTAVTDENGYYTINNLVDPGTLKGTLSAQNCDSVTVRRDNITGAGEYNLAINDADNKIFGYWLFQKGYQNLRDSEYGYKIYSTGLIHPEKLASDQHSETIKMRDKNGVYLLRSRNHGDPVNVLGISVEPRVDLIGYYDSVNSAPNTMQYKFIKGEAITYTNGKVDTNPDALKNNAFGNIAITGAGSFAATYGVNPTGMYIYNIASRNDVQSISNLSVAGNGNINLVMNLKISDSLVANYKTQMNAFSGQTPSISAISFNMTLDKFGNILSNTITENYSVKQMGVTVNITATLSERYTMFTAENADANLVVKSDFGN